MVVTPGDVLQRCQALSARIAETSRAIDAGGELFDAAFRASWRARLRRWAEVRGQCGDWGSRWWNFKWGPILDDWRANQSTWERVVEERTGLAIQVPQHDPREDEQPVDRLGELGDSLTLGVTAGLAVLFGAAALAVVLRAKRA